MPVFPATESTLSATHLGDFLRAKYSLSPGSTCRLFRTGMNHLYMIADGETKFVFRVYTHAWRSRDTWSNIFLNEDHLRRYIGSVKRWFELQ